MVHLWDTVIFKVKRPDSPYPFLTMLNKNEAVWSICSGEIVHLEILQCDWLDLYLRNNVFPKYRICAGTQQIIFGLGLTHFSNFGGKKRFSAKSGCHAQLHKGFWYHAKIQRYLMIEFEENNQENNNLKKGWTDPISQDLSSYCQGSHKYNCSRLAFKSQRYRVQWWHNQKLLHHYQHSSNQLNAYIHS